MEREDEREGGERESSGPDETRSERDAGQSERREYQLVQEARLARDLRAAGLL
jgi:hypothetical protein